MSTPDETKDSKQPESKKLRGIFTLVMLVCAAAVGGCYFAAILK
jgi:hypothetical protein